MAKRTAARAAKQPAKSAAETLAATLAARDIEHSRFGRLLHDEVGPLLSAAGLQLDLLRMDAEPQSPDLAGRALMIQQLLEQAMTHVRDLSRELNAGLVERTGFRFALEELVEKTRASFGGKVRLAWNTPLRVPVEIGAVFYEIAERALANSVTHSGAGRIDVSLSGLRHPTLQLRDDGKGFDVERAKRQDGVGLLIMEAVAAAAGLTFSVKSELGRGTIVTASYRAPRQGK